MRSGFRRGGRVANSASGNDIGFRVWGVKGVSSGGYFSLPYGHATKTRVAMRFNDWYRNEGRGYLGFIW